MRTGYCDFHSVSLCGISLTAENSGCYNEAEVIPMNIQFTQITRTGILPVIKVEKLSDALPLAEALRAGGTNAIEVTVRSEAAYDAIHAISEAYPDMAVGAGTILTTDMADRALTAGAKYIVAPGLDPEVIKHCQNAGVVAVPGCSTGSEINMAVKLGLTLVKFFPAELSGGVAAIKLLSGPFPGVKFIPTGGIDESNLAGYLRCDAVAACGGSFMAKADVIRAGNWEVITQACKRCVGLSLGFELAHVGVNCESEENAHEGASRMAGLFSLSVKNGKSSVFAGKAVEYMKSPYWGKNGHIGYYTNSVSRALEWFRTEGVAIRENSICTDAQGKPISFYFEDEIGGFAVHVVKK